MSCLLKLTHKNSLFSFPRNVCANVLVFPEYQHLQKVHESNGVSEALRYKPVVAGSIPGGVVGIFHFQK